MDLRDATLMFLSESADHPAVASLAQSAYDQLAAGEEVDYRLLDDLIGEASRSGSAAWIRKYGPRTLAATCRSNSAVSQSCNGLCWTTAALLTTPSIRP